LFDGKGRQRALLQAQDQGSFLSLPGVNKKSNLMLINQSEPTIYLTDNNAKIRAELSTKGDTVRMIMTDPSEKESMILAAAKDGPSVSCFDDQRKLRVQLSVFGEMSRFSLLDGRQVQRTSLHATNDSAGVAVADENEIRRAAM